MRCILIIKGLRKVNNDVYDFLFIDILYGLPQTAGNFSFGLIEISAFCNSRFKYLSSGENCNIMY
jgi:hypothetical protein